MPAASFATEERLLKEALGGLAAECDYLRRNKPPAYQPVPLHRPAERRQQELPPRPASEQQSSLMRPKAYAFQRKLEMEAVVAAQGSHFSFGGRKFGPSYEEERHYVNSLGAHLRHAPHYSVAHVQVEQHERMAGNRARVLARHGLTIPEDMRVQAGRAGGARDSAYAYPPQRAASAGRRAEWRF